MKSIYFLFTLLGCSSVAIASEIPSIYSCTGAYVIPVTHISSTEFCQAVQQAPTNVKKIEFIETAANKYYLTSVQCGDDVNRLVNGVLFRLFAESVDKNVFKKLRDRKADVNSVVDSQMRDITPAGVAAICGYKENLMELIQLGGIPKANLEMSLSTNGVAQTRTFSLTDAMDFNDAGNSNYENMDLQNQNIVFDEIYKIIEKF